MGSKRLKAITVQGTKKLPIAKPERLKEMIKEVVKECVTHPNMNVIDPRIDMPDIGPTFPVTILGAAL
jgi:aldehyde:ferredoxin oxidoreductase